MSQIGPYTRLMSLKSIDGRRREAKLLQQVRAELTEHVGGKPTVPQRMLIERAAALTLRVALLDRKVLDEGVMTEHDSRIYLGWSRALANVLTALGLKAAPDAPVDPVAALHAHLAAQGAAA